MKIELNLIDADADWNCRGAIQLHDVKELADDIKQNGLIHAVTVRRVGERYSLVAGFRRFAAAGLLKWTSIEATVVEADEHQSLVLNLSENIARKSINPVMEANTVERLFPRAHYSIAETAKRLRKHNSWVQIRRHLLKLPEGVQTMIASGRLPLNRIDFLRNAPDVMQAAEEAAKRIKHKRAPDLERPRRKHKDVVNDMQVRLIDLGLQGLVTRALAWANGHISDATFEFDIEQALRGQQ